MPEPPKDVLKIGLRTLDILLDEVFRGDLEEFLRINALVKEAEALGFKLHHPESGKELKYFEAKVIEPLAPLGGYTRFFSASRCSGRCILAGSGRKLCWASLYGERSISVDDKNKTILSVLAHPDDESFGMGGTLALYATRGAAVHLVCATRGEVGEVGPEYLRDYASIGELREAELRCASGHLGLAGVYFMDYRDSGMPGSPDNQHPQALAAQPLEQVAACVAQYIRKIRPQVVLTFDPIGGYYHPDHVAIHKATVQGLRAGWRPVFPWRWG